jgi:fructose-1,6-bisphosphatase/inositol monophosphatase family enzyme
MGDTSEDGVGVGVGLALRDGCGELIVGFGLVGVTVGVEMAGATVAGVVAGAVVEELFAADGGLTQR